MQAKNITGIVLDIQRFAVHDGPGIRTTVFLKGCNLRCAWCHNPESFVVKPQLSYNRSACTSCGACVAACPHGVHTILADGTHVLDRSRCTGCGACVEACPQRCLSIFGYPMAAGQVLDEVVKDVKYYSASGGGVTFSGGEPTVQFEFLLACAQLCKAAGVHICLETNGIIPPAHLEKLIPLLDVVLLDYKMTGDEGHKKYTGAGVAGVLTTLDRLCHRGVPVILRCPIIPGINDDSEHFSCIRKLRSTYHNIQNVEVMPYHSLGGHKWDAIGIDYTLRDVVEPTAEQKQNWAAMVLPLDRL